MARQSSIAGLFAVLCWSGVYVTTAHATVILTEDSRSIEAYARVVETQSQDEIGPILDAPAFGAPFDAVVDTGTLVSTPTGAAQAQADASQESNFDAVPTFTTFSASGAANAMYETVPGTNLGEGISASDVLIQFSVDSTQAWSITASILDEGGSSFAYVRLRRAGSSNYLFNLEGTGNLFDAAAGELQPAEYELTARASTTVPGPARAWFPSRHARFEFEIVIVPEPGGLALLLIGGLGLMRRRRA